MDPNNFRAFESNQEDHRQAVKAVGELNLLPGAGRTEYILASVDVLNRLLGRRVTLPELEGTLYDVVRWRLWDIENTHDDRPLLIQHTGTIHRECLESLAYLDSNGLIMSMEVTDLGANLVNDMTMPERLSL